MKKVTFGAQILLGLVFFVFGLNGFLNFIPVPPNMPEGALKFMGGLMSAPYFMPVLKGTEVIGGLLLLTNSWVAFAAIVLAPITVQIFLFHFFLTPGEWAIAAVMVIFHVLVFIGQKEKVSPLFNRK